MMDFGFYNMDCMQGMKEFPDKYFDLAIVDPPYGDGGVNGRELNGSEKDSTVIDHLHSCQRKAERLRRTSSEMGGWSRRTGGTWAGKFGKKIIAWDTAPKQEYFDELFRVSRNQIIWGGNYFELPKTRCFLIWRKTNVPEDFSMAMAEYAWTSFNKNAKVFEFSAVGQPGRFHPTQKPIELYDWILRNYAKPGDKILDTHVGSASSLIACKRLKFDFVGFEIDKDYYDMACKRYEQETAQMTLAQLFGEDG